jgi:hypothetical protein
MRLFEFSLIEKASLTRLSRTRPERDNGPNEKEGPTGCALQECEPYSPFQNRAEAGIREMKRAVVQHGKKASPMKLWDYCAELQCEIVRIQPLICMRSAD